jgi:hypothetical protein
MRSISAPLWTPVLPITVKEWYATAGLDDVRVRLGGNGILGNGRARAVAVFISGYEYLASQYRI